MDMFVCIFILKHFTDPKNLYSPYSSVEGPSYPDVPVNPVSLELVHTPG